MGLKSDANGIFIEGMTDSVELAGYLNENSKKKTSKILTRV